MALEIAEQPVLLRNKAEAWEIEAADQLERVQGRDDMAVVGRGSSGNACIFASYLYALRTGRQPVEFRPWLVTQQLPEVALGGFFVLAYSASGHSTDVGRAAQWLRKSGAHVIGITNAIEPDCHLARASDQLFHLNVGPELAVPATKTLCAQLFVSAALCGYPIREAAHEASEAMEAVLAARWMSETATLLSAGRTSVWIARGPSLASALDAALKMQEVSGLPSLAWSTAEFLHGPISAMSDQDRAVLLVDDETPSNSLEVVIKKLVACGTPFVIVAGEKASPLPGDLTIRIPLPRERWACTPVFCTLSQVLALSVAQQRGLDPDRPAGLNKITRT
jgi:glucosamine--fructose-6-phosphate aminotransferase (isomerizing)